MSPSLKFLTPRPLPIEDLPQPGSCSPLSTECNYLRPSPAAAAVKYENYYVSRATRNQCHKPTPPHHEAGPPSTPYAGHVHGNYGSASPATSISASSLRSLPKTPHRVRFASLPPSPKRRHHHDDSERVADGRTASTVTLHPFLAKTHHSAPISYDVTCAPSPLTVYDRSAHYNASLRLLSEPATSPPCAEITVLCERLPHQWAPTVRAGAGAAHQPYQAAGPYVTVLDVLAALHEALRVPIAHAEWAVLERGSEAEGRVAHAYTDRCAKEGGGSWAQGLRRVDWLCGNTRLAGLRTTDDGRVLAIFKRP